MTGPRQVLTLGVGDATFAVPITTVQEILDMRPITHLPDAPTDSLASSTSMERGSRQTALQGLERGGIQRGRSGINLALAAAMASQAVRPDSARDPPAQYDCILREAQ